jgi:hypothetical protein
LSDRGREILEAARAFGTGGSAQEREQLARQEATFHHLTTLAAFLRLARQGRPAEAIRVRAKRANSQPTAGLSSVEHGGRLVAMTYVVSAYEEP